jgi:high-affinity Fe2+/Pb2+ permease
VNITPDWWTSELAEMAYFVVTAGFLIAIAFWLFAAAGWIMERMGRP